RSRTRLGSGGGVGRGGQPEQALGRHGCDEQPALKCLHFVSPGSMSSNEPTGSTTCSGWTAFFSSLFGCGVGGISGRRAVFRRGDSRAHQNGPPGRACAIAAGITSCVESWCRSGPLPCRAVGPVLHSCVCTFGLSCG